MPCSGNEALEVHLQDVGDDPDAPHVGFESQWLIADNLWSFKGTQAKCITVKNNLFQFNKLPVQHI